MILIRRRDIAGSLNKLWTLDFGLWTFARQDHRGATRCELSALRVLHPDLALDIAFAAFDPLACHRSFTDQRLVHIGDVAVGVGELFQSSFFSDPTSQKLRQERATQGTVDDHVAVTLGQSVVLVIMNALRIPGDRAVKEQ